MGKALREFKSSSDDKESTTETEEAAPTAQKHDSTADDVNTSAEAPKESEKETPTST